LIFALKLLTGAVIIGVISSFCTQVPESKRKLAVSAPTFNTARKSL
jgi:hypothetical protein